MSPKEQPLTLINENLNNVIIKNKTKQRSVRKRYILEISEGFDGVVKGRIYDVQTTWLWAHN